MYVWSHCNDEFNSDTFSTLEAALAEARSEARITNAFNREHLKHKDEDMIKLVFVGVTEPSPCPSQFFDLDMLDDAVRDGDVLCEEEEDDYEGFGGAPEKDKEELVEKVKGILEEFCAKHGIKINSYKIGNVQEYPVDEPESEALKS